MLRASARLRLTATFASGVLLVGGAIVGAVFLVMRYVPTYRIIDGSDPAFTSVPAGAADARSGEAAPATPVTSLTVTGESDVLRLLLTTSGVVLAITTVIGVWASWIIAGRVLRPVTELADAAAQVELGTGSRIDSMNEHDEFGRLTTTVNEMLDRLDRSYEAQRRFAANASHELRTPLATTKAMLDVAAAMPGAADTVELVGRLSETNARSIGTVEALLDLADAEGGASEHVRVDLGAVVARSLTRLHDGVRTRRITVRTEIEPCTVDGDPALLESMVDNLLGNAERHNVDAGWIDVELRDGSLRIDNSGRPIDDETVARLTEPFFRGAGRVAGSHGLGLALVSAVADTHGFTLEMASLPGGGLRVGVGFGTTSSAGCAGAPRVQTTTAAPP